MIRLIDIPQVLLQILRPNYAVTGNEGYSGLQYLDVGNNTMFITADSTSTVPEYLLVQGLGSNRSVNKLYAFLLACVWVLKGDMDSWDTLKRREFAVASCQGGRAQVLAILQLYYPNAQARWAVTNNEYYLYRESDTTAPDVFWYQESDTDADPVYLYRPTTASASGIIEVDVDWATDADNESELSNFIADAQAMQPYGTQILVRTYSA